MEQDFPGRHIPVSIFGLLLGRLAFMNCPQCGDFCHCLSEPPPLTLPQESAQNPSAVTDAAWRNELSERLSRYRARRKARPPRYPSLRLQFEAFETLSKPRAVTGSCPPVFESVANHALALDSAHFETTAETGVDLPTADAESSVADGQPDSSASSVSAGYSGGGFSRAKIIEFPRFAWGPPQPPPDQLAEPITERPRILEVPEVEPPPPALGGITIEAAEPHEAEKRPGIDIPLQGASLARRLLAVAVDGLIVVAASGAFGAIFWRVTGVRPPMIQLIGLGVGIPCLLWAVYQYLLIVYSGATPGLRAAGLELTRFDGSAAGRSLRRWRILACYLSAASLGMGYAWAFLDEDVLCWHDRITHTYLAPKE
jgi:uncharacterized RDD family membrane protein YckC